MTRAQLNWGSCAFLVSASGIVSTPTIRGKLVEPPFGGRTLRHPQSESLPSATGSVRMVKQDHPNVLQPSPFGAPNATPDFNARGRIPIVERPSLLDVDKISA